MKLQKNDFLHKSNNSLHVFVKPRLLIEINLVCVGIVSDYLGLLRVVSPYVESHIDSVYGESTWLRLSVRMSQKANVECSNPDHYISEHFRKSSKSFETLVLGVKIVHDFGPLIKIPLPEFPFSTIHTITFLQFFNFVPFLVMFSFPSDIV